MHASASFGNREAYNIPYGQSSRKLKLARAEPWKLTTSSDRARKTYNQSPRNLQLARAKPSKRTTSSGKALDQVKVAVYRLL